MHFDIDRYREGAARLDDADIDYGAFRDHPLTRADLRCIRYMHDVEHHTVCYLRDLLVTRAHRDPAVTTFLTLWAFEELWHGEALGKVLAAHGEVAGNERVARHRAGLGLKERLGPIPSMVGSAVLREFTAVHMTWGAVNEWGTQAGYARLRQKARHPVLDDLLARIMKQEGRHIDFYASEAETRLARSRSARRITRFALRRLWSPVGAGVMPASELRFLMRHLFGGPEGLKAAERIDRRVRRLPGLEDLSITVDARAEHMPTSPAPARRQGPALADRLPTPPVPEGAYSRAA